MNFNYEERLDNSASNHSFNSSNYNQVSNVFTQLMNLLANAYIFIITFEWLTKFTNREITQEDSQTKNLMIMENDQTYLLIIVKWEEIKNQENLRIHKNYQITK